VIFDLKICGLLPHFFKIKENIIFWGQNLPTSSQKPSFFGLWGRRRNQANPNFILQVKHYLRTFC
jgi:hypothetical protein